MIGFHEARHLMDNFSHRKNMMSGDVSPLQFANLDATLYGADLRFSYNLNSNLYLSGLASCVRAIRDDNDDNLYLISPANAALSLNYLANDWDAVITFKAVAA